MKFTDGFWLLRPGVTMVNAAQVRDVRVDGDAAYIYASHRPITDRGTTLNVPMLTLRVTSPMPDVLSVQVSHFTGSARKEPRFDLYTEPSPLDVRQDEAEIVITAGKLSLTITRERFSLAYRYEGRLLTGLGDRHLGYATTPEGRFIRCKLDVGVGEKLYGLGERFTPFVRNGQSVEVWNQDGGTASEQAYKNVPFYASSRGYGVFVNTTDRVSYELCSEAVSSAQFSVAGEQMEFMVIGGPSVQDSVLRYVRLTGKPALPPAWSFGLWLTTSFTTDYSEETVNGFIDGMLDRDIPLHVFHFDCFWMKEYEWCNFTWDETMFPDPIGLLARLKAKGLKICVWVNPYIAQKSPLFEEGRQAGYLLKRPNGDVWQWDMWQAGMGLVDFTNPAAARWYQGKLRALMEMGVDCFKSDFGERIPTDVAYFDGSDPHMMHNYYTQLYNKTIFELLEAQRGKGEACLFARSATTGGQQYPVHWGGDSSSNYPSMAETLRGGLSLAMSGFSFWSHDISGFEETATPDAYKRWTAFGLLSTHSRLHGSTSYRVPWLFDEEAVDVLRHFTRLKCRLMPYLFAASVVAHQTGLPVMRPMAMAFGGDPACEDLDRQYMLGDSLLVAPVFQENGLCAYYLPDGTWTHLLSHQRVRGGHWQEEAYDYFSLPLFVKENTLLPMGQSATEVCYAYQDGLTLHAYAGAEGLDASVQLYGIDAAPCFRATVRTEGGKLILNMEGTHRGLSLALHGLRTEGALPDGVSRGEEEGLDALAITDMVSSVALQVVPV